MSSIDKAQALAEAHVCEELDDAERAFLADRMGVVELDAGASLVSEGETSRTLFILVSGQLDVVRARGQAEEVVHKMKPGECAGTRSFIDGTPRQVTLRAKAPSGVLTLEPEAFDALVEERPRLTHKVMRGIFRVTHGNLMRKNVESKQLEDYFLRTGNRH